MHVSTTGVGVGYLLAAIARAQSQLRPIGCKPLDAAAKMQSGAAPQNFSAALPVGKTKEGVAAEERGLRKSQADRTACTTFIVGFNPVQTGRLPSFLSCGRTFSLQLCIQHG